MGSKQLTGDVNGLRDTGTTAYIHVSYTPVSYAKIQMVSTTSINEHDFYKKMTVQLQHTHYDDSGIGRLHWGHVQGTRYLEYVNRMYSQAWHYPRAH